MADPQEQAKEASKSFNPKEQAEFQAGIAEGHSPASMKAGIEKRRSRASESQHQPETEPISIKNIDAIADDVYVSAKSGVSKIAKYLEQKPKTQAQIERETKTREAYEKSRLQAEITRARYAGFHAAYLKTSPKQPSFQDLGKSSMGAKRYEPYKKDMGTSRYEPQKRIMSPFLFQMRTSDTMGMSFSVGKNPVGTIETIRGDPVGNIIGIPRVSTRIPISRNKTPVSPKGGKYVSVNTRKPIPIKVKVAPIKKDATDILGLRGFF